MKHIFYKKWMRILAGILCILSVNAAGVSFFGILYMEDQHIYDRNKEDLQNEAYQKACRNYSIRALSAAGVGFDMEELEDDTRFRFGVIQASNIDELDLNDRSIYTVCNFGPEKMIDREELNKSITVYSCTIGKDTQIHLEESFLGDNYIYNPSTQEYTSESVSYVIEQIYYTSDTNHFYYLTHTDDGITQIYPAKAEVGQSEEGDPAGEFIVPVEEAAADEEKPEKTIADADIEEEIPKAEEIPADQEQTPSYQWLRTDVRMRVEEGVTRYLADIQITTFPKLAKMGSIISRETDYTCDDGVIQTWHETETYTRAEGEPYFVISYMDKEQEYPGIVVTNSLLTLFTSWNQMDYFAQSASIVEIAYQSRYAVYVIFLCALVLFGVSLCICIMGAGHRDGEAEIMPGFCQKIPYDVFLVLAFFLECFLIGMVMLFLSGIDTSVRAAMFFGALALLPGEVLALVVILDFAVRVKTKNVIRNTLCYRFGHRILDGIRRGIKTCFRSLPMLWKAWLVMALWMILEFILIASFTYENVDAVLFFLLVEKGVVYSVLTVGLLQLDKLKKATERIASGEVDAHVDTEKMFWEFKKHGENLNKIREGINSAVEQRMKSERFKTELITNVSHDIKTPLTSIINYVDLLEKEEIDNPKIQEYLEVLSRQSARLKKLIEDLMEASKASTGNISVSLEPCNIKILVTQMIGEFEEKLNASHIELIVQGGGEEIKIPADTRHLYRVFENLMNNICKYALESTRAYVNVEQQEQRCIIIFRNISRYPLNIGSEELMERFVRGDASRNTEGSGLGLSIAKSLTELMGGVFELVVDGDLFKVVLSFPIITKTS